jgi:hypothetical protein
MITCKKGRFQVLVAAKECGVRKGVSRIVAVRAWEYALFLR